MGCLFHKNIPVIILYENKFVKARELKIRRNSKKREIGNMLYTAIKEYQDEGYDMNISIQVCGVETNDLSFLHKATQITVELKKKDPLCNV